MKAMLLSGTKNGKIIIDKVFNKSDFDFTVFTYDLSLSQKYSGYDDHREYDPISTLHINREKDKITNLKPDYIFILAWSQIISKDILQIPTIGTIGKHFSLLPRRRGGAPIASAIIDGLEESGVTLLWTDEGVDTGDMITQKPFPIYPNDRAQDVLDRANEVAVELFSDVIRKIESGEPLDRIKQNEDNATYTHPRTPDMGEIDWIKNVIQIYNFIRALTSPYPPSFTFYKTHKILVKDAKVNEIGDYCQGSPGQILKKYSDNRFLVQASDGTIEIEVLSKDQRIEEGGIFH